MGGGYFTSMPGIEPKDIQSKCSVIVSLPQPTKASLKPGLKNRQWSRERYMGYLRLLPSMSAEDPGLSLHTTNDSPCTARNDLEQC